MDDGVPALRLGGSEWILLVVLAVLWGGSFTFNEIALRELGPFTVVAWRIGGGCLALWIVAVALGVRIPLDPRTWAGFAVLGLLNNVVPFFLIVWGQARIDSGLAAILNATTPMFGLVLAHFFTLDERINLPRATGLLLGLAGVIVLVGPNALGGLTASSMGQAAVLGAGLSYACAGVFGRRVKRLDPLVMALGMLTAASAMIIPAALVFEDAARLPASVAVWGALAGLAVPGAAAAYVIYFRILATAGATNLLLVTLLIPFAAIFLGVALLGEALSPAMVAGFALVLAGLVVIDGRALAWARG